MIAELSGTDRLFILCAFIFAFTAALCLVDFVLGYLELKREDRKAERQWRRAHMHDGSPDMVREIYDVIPPPRLSADEGVRVLYPKPFDQDAE